MKKTIKIRNKYIYILIVLIGAVINFMQEDSPIREAVSPDKSQTKSVTGELRLHFIDVGQADSILIEDGSHAMLIDGGNNDDGELVTSYIREQGYEQLDYVIGTHPHEDHIGGIDDVIWTFDVEHIILPDKIHTTKTYEDVLNAIEENDVPVTIANPGDCFSLGEAEVTVLSPGEDYGDELNNWSVSVKIQYGKNSFVLTGDAEKEAEADMIATGISLKADVWKAAHHGSTTSNSAKMLDAVDPSIAIISCGEGNDYGHPHREIVKAFKDRNIETYRTDQQGTIVVTSDGTNITVNTER